MSKDLRYSFVCLYSFNGIWTPGEVQSSLSCFLSLCVCAHEYTWTQFLWGREEWTLKRRLFSSSVCLPDYSCFPFSLLPSDFAIFILSSCTLAVHYRMKTTQPGAANQSSFSGCHHLLSPVELMLIHKISSAHLLLSLNVPNSMASLEKVNETILIFNPQAPKVELFAFSCFLYYCRYTDSKTQASARCKYSVYLSGFLFFLLLCPYDVRACLYVCLWHTAPFSSVQGSITIRLSGNIVADGGTH